MRHGTLTPEAARGLSVMVRDLGARCTAEEISARVGRRVTTSQVRWACERSGMPDSQAQWEMEGMREDVERMVADGLSLPEVTCATGRARSTVQRALHRWGWRYDRNAQEWRREDGGAR